MEALVPVADWCIRVGNTDPREEDTFGGMYNREGPTGPIAITLFF